MTVATHRLSDLRGSPNKQNRLCTVRLAYKVDVRAPRDNLRFGDLPERELAADFPELVIRSFADLADALLAVKNFRGLSNNCLEELAGVCPGWVDKYLGRSRSKRLSETSFDLLIGALGLELVVRQDPEAARKMAHRWERRNELQVRTCQPLSAELLERARAIIMAELGFVGEQRPHERPPQRQRLQGVTR